MSRNMQVSQTTASVPRGWPSMAAASAGICGSSRASGRAGARDSAVLSLVAPAPVADVPALEIPKKYTAVARLEGQVVVTLWPTGIPGEPTTLTIPLTAKVAGGEALVPEGQAAL